MPQAAIVEVTQAESGQKLVQFLERRLQGDVPRSAIMRWIRKGQVRVNKGRKKPFDRVRAGQNVRIPPYRAEDAPQQSAESQAKPLDIIHHENGLLAVNKPAGLAVHGGDGHDDSVAARLQAMYPDADFGPTLCHRLDRDTSGLLLAATSYATLRAMNDRFASNGVHKLYLAWVAGCWTRPGKTMLRDRVEKKGGPGSEKMTTGSGKHAEAEVVCLCSHDTASLMAIRLLTGRTHQIRLQLASREHPVIGDGKYGKIARTGLKLHCFCLQLPKQTFCLPPAWQGKWTVSETHLRKARGLLPNEFLV